MTDSVVGASPRQLARIAGALYLINIVGGAFAITVVPAMLVVQGDAAATAHNIQTHELLYRAGLAAHVLVTVTNVPLAVIFYELFKVVNRRFALLDAFFDLGGNSLQAMRLITRLRTDLAVDADVTAVFLAPTPGQESHLNACHLPQEVKDREGARFVDREEVA